MMSTEHCCELGCCDSCQQPTDLSVKQPSKKLKPIPPPLDLAGPPTLTLKEFAIIATSPKSPLMQKNLPFRKRAYSFPSNEETTPPATPPQLPPPPPPPPPQPSPPVAPSCSALLSPAPSSVGSSREDLCPWPFPVWHCFQSGSMIKLPGETGWHRAEDLASAGFHCDWLQFETFENLRNGSMKVIFNGCQGKFEAHCLTLNTFYTQEKGWCAICPNEVARNYGLLCPPLESGDVCLQPCSTITTPDICENLRRFSFPPDESVSPKPVAPVDKAKRPMNAFMLFAKRYRLELIQMHPGKDNRAISVLLGEAWRRMSHTEKQVYVAEARALAQEQKRRHPDCWKRKRSLSTS